MENKLTLGLIQMALGEDIAQNVQRTIEKIYSAAEQGAQIVCLQELFNTRYIAQSVTPEGYDTAESADNDTLRKMAQIAAELNIVLIVPFYEKAGRGIYFNSAAVIDADGSLLGITRKNHIPDGPQYHEKYYFIPGNTGYPVYETKYGIIGVGICWDEWFPEVARILTLQGAEMLFYPSAIGSEPDNPELSTHCAWEKVISSHGITNGLFVAAVNRVGQENNMTFYGGSFVSDPLGTILKSLGEEEGILIQEIDLSRIDFARNLLQFLRDRRTDTYGPLLQQEILKKPKWFRKQFFNIHDK
jgi:N-carbamoylputrescine amidase